ncbi:hypothetical protein AC249_AIPGENE6484 [Exaiptasia diaphana]|nr:hypothetical protein AC249_AIPGENE6484 [Exaiptasia diaphana]
MSDYLLQSEQKRLDNKLKVPDSSFSYINQSHVNDSDIAVAVDIPYPVLMKWHGLVGTKDDEGNTLDYITLLNAWIPGHWFKIDKAHGSRITGRLRREAGAIVKKYKGKKVSGSKREEANAKSLTLHIRELIKPEEVERTLSMAEEEIKAWKEKCKDLEREKEDILETILYLIDKFCASDELYHEFSMISNDLPRTYLIKQKKNDLNKLCHIERTPAQHPGAQLSFTDTLKEHINDFKKDNPNHPQNDPMIVKISCDGAKMKTAEEFIEAYRKCSDGDDQLKQTPICETPRSTKTQLKPVGLGKKKHSGTSMETLTELISPPKKQCGKSFDDDIAMHHLGIH